MVSLPCTTNLTFICIVGVTYSMIGCIVLNQRSWRNINCALGKICYILIFISIPFPCPFKQCFKGGLCWFFYQVSTHLFTYDTFIHFEEHVHRLTVTFFISRKRKEIFKHSFEILFLVCNEIHKSNKILLTSILSIKIHFFFNTSFKKYNL